MDSTDIRESGSIAENETPASGDTAQYDLLNDSWITALDLRGRPRAESLRTVFRNANEISTLTGELPTQSFAMLRLLLAVLHRSITQRSESPIQIWQHLWATTGSLSDHVDDYLIDHAHRFQLFHPEMPFFQVAGLHSAAGGTSALDRLIADVPNGEKYFTTRAGAGLDRIDFGEAARWLVHAHAFDPSGIKTGAVGDRRVKGGKGYPIGVAWTGCLGGVFLEGRNLRETLLLNLVLLDINAERFARDDLPPWERPADQPDVDPTRRPTGPVDLYTWQSRRIRLVHNNTHVTGVVLCNGDSLEIFNRHLLEPMTGWRYSEAQTKKAGGRTRHYPLTHDPQRGLWRGLTALLQEMGGNISGEAIPPGLLDWLCRLLDADALDPTHQVRLHGVGMQYVNNQSIVGDIFDDTIGFRVALLSTNPVLRNTAINAVKVAEDAVRALGSLAGNLAAAAGGEPEGARSRALERGYFALENPYRRWLAALHPEGDPHEYDQGWQRAVRRDIEPLGRDLVAAAGTPAWVGREVNGTYLDANLADIWFGRRVRKLLPAAYDNHADNGGTTA